MRQKSEQVSHSEQLKSTTTKKKKQPKIQRDARWRAFTTHSEQVLIPPASGMWWQPSRTQLESCSGSGRRQVVTQDALCKHTHILGSFHSLLSVFLLNARSAQETEARRKREGAETGVCTDIDSSSDNSSITPCVWVFLRVSAQNVCMHVCVCVRTGRVC